MNMVRLFSEIFFAYACPHSGTLEFVVLGCSCGEKQIVGLPDPGPPCYARRVAVLRTTQKRLIRYIALQFPAHEA